WPLKGIQIAAARGRTSSGATHGTQRVAGQSSHGRRVRDAHDGAPKSVDRRHADHLGARHWGDDGGLQHREHAAHSSPPLPEREPHRLRRATAKRRKQYRDQSEHHAGRASRSRLDAALAKLRDVRGKTTWPALYEDEER